jgi:hypothetical protein
MAIKGPKIGKREECRNSECRYAGMQVKNNAGIQNAGMQECR